MAVLASDVLMLLADGEFHSGTAIGDVMGVSRTAVWKHLQKLADIGLSIESVKGRGYRLKGGLKLLNKDYIESLLDADVRNAVSNLDLRMQTESTNDVAMTHVNEGGESGYICLAEYQQSGRGRRGRRWVSPFGHNIYLSLVWEFDGGVSQLEGLSLAVGVAVATVLNAAGLTDVSLKWPNDILLESRKLGGVLLEMSGDPTGVCKVVVGVGLNVHMASDVAVDQPWSAMSQQLPEVSRNQLVANLINHLVTLLEGFGQQGFQYYRASWETMDAYRNQTVQIISGDTVVEGVAIGVYDNGALRLMVDGKEKAIHGGEVSLRVKA